MPNPNYESHKFVPEGFDWKHPNYDVVYAERVTRLKRLRETPGNLPALKAYYAENPAIFISDWMLTSDPRNAEVGLPVVVPFILFPQQVEFIDWMYGLWKGRSDGLAEKSRDVGASWLCVAFAVWMWTFYPDTVVGIGSRKEALLDAAGDPKTLFWKARQCINFLPAEFKPAGWNELKDAPNMRVINRENGSTIIGESGDNIGRGARASLYIVDEAAFLDNPDAIDAALSQTSNVKLYISTPNGAGNSFYRRRHNGKTSVFSFSWQSDPRKGPDWYAKQVATLDPVIVAQEIDMQYEGSVANAFIPADIVTSAMQRGPADVQPIGGLRVGLDVARFGDDKSCISFRRGRVVLKQIVLAKLDVAQVAARCKQEIDAFRETPEQIAVDTIGVGAGAADMLRGWFPDRLERSTGRMRKIVVDVNSASRMADGTHYNLRAFMWAQMKEWMREGSIPNDNDLKVDLTALRYGFRGGELLLESKEDAKRRGVKSPDRADSLAMTFAVPTIVKVDRNTRRLPKFKGTVAGMGALG